MNTTDFTAGSSSGSSPSRSTAIPTLPPACSTARSSATRYGTNPDMLLVIEARKPGDAQPEWQYGIARLGAGRLFLDLDQKQVWAEGGTGIPANLGTYMNRFERDRDQQD